ncbi:MAG: KEOPS complex subunit Cgi121 [Candidatus Methanoperedens sp.]|nr:KEOPS complex subunit Cgi121 [Candidatus Methanoperedens sp.]MCZ7369959.1 KEOPS complex subunit Cgi121 [Candidatus Methanoperedens sp.]
MIQILEGTVFIEGLDEFLNKLKKISKEKNITIQAFDADKLAGEEHVRFAVKKAINSFENKRNIANDLSKEIMLYVSGTRQINKAMRLGIHKGENNIVLVAIGEKPDFSEFDEIMPKPVLQYHESKKEAIMQAFNITDEEIKAVGEEKIPELVLERVALVDVIK